MDRKQSILAAARQCMRETGFHNTSVKNIADAAGISTGLIYRYFKSKDDIVEQLVVDVVARLKGLLDSNASEREKLISFFSLSEKNAASREAVSNIALLIDISAEAHRNEYYKKMLTDAWHELNLNAIRKSGPIASSEPENIIRTRLYFLSILIDGLIINRLRKKNQQTVELHDVMAIIAADLVGEN